MKVTVTLLTIVVAVVFYIWLRLFKSMLRPGYEVKNGRC